MAEELNEKEIAELRKKFPLPDGVTDAVLTRAALARAFDVSVNTIDKWIGNGMPVARRGTSGQSYEFRLADCWAWREDGIAREKESERAQEEAVRAMRLKLIGGESGSGIDALPPRAKQEIYRTQAEYEQLKAARHELIRREDVEVLLEDVFSLVRDGVSTLPDRLERDAGIKGKAIEKAFAVCDRVLTETQSKIEEFFKARPKDRAEARRELFNA